jgi:hypothetical protein
MKMRALGFSFGIAMALAPFAGNACDAHWIKDILGDGSTIKLEDGTVWHVDEADQYIASLWLETSKVVVCEHRITKTSDNQTVNAHRRN